jgi:hypothetical protein
VQAHKITRQRRVAVFQQHGDHLLEVGLQFIEGRALAVSTRESRNVANEQTGFCTALDHGREGTHSPIWFLDIPSGLADGEGKGMETLSTSPPTQSSRLPMSASIEQPSWLATSLRICRKVPTLRG